MPMKSFLIRTSPARGTGTGKSVLYCRTSVLPKFCICTPFMVLGRGMEDMVACNRSCNKQVEGLRVEARRGINTFCVVTLMNMCC